MGSRLLNGSSQLSVRVTLFPLTLIVLLSTVTSGITEGKGGITVGIGDGIGNIEQIVVLIIDIGVTIFNAVPTIDTGVIILDIVVVIHIIVGVDMIVVVYPVVVGVIIVAIVGTITVGTGVGVVIMLTIVGTLTVGNGVGVVIILAIVGTLTIGVGIEVILTLVVKPILDMVENSMIVIMISTYVHCICTYMYVHTSIHTLLCAKE